jgi:tRNA1(Val) A37 N6-methylase TrmN6
MCQFFLEEYPNEARTDLERRLQIITITSREILHRAGFLCSLNCLASLFQMTDILQVSRLASACVQSSVDTSQDNSGTMLSSAIVSCMRQGK